MSLAKAIADAPMPAYNQIKCPLLCVAGQEDQVAHLEDLALIGDRQVLTRLYKPSYAPPTLKLPMHAWKLNTDLHPDGEHRPKQNSKSCSE